MRNFLNKLFRIFGALYVQLTTKIWGFAQRVLELSGFSIGSALFPSFRRPLSAKLYVRCTEILDVQK